TSYVNVTLGEGTHGSSFVGGFMGYANHETIIENCSWYGTLDLGANRADSGVGGLVGRLYDKSSVTIRNCASYGTIKTSYKSGTHNNYDTIYIGGVLSFSPAETQAVLENNLWAGKFTDGTDLGEKAHLSAFGTLNGKESVTNCYTIDSVPYITTENQNTDGITIVTAQQLASGEVAYKLGEFWGQTIGTDDYPVLGGEKVYSNGETYCNRVLGDADGDMLVTSEDSVILSRYFAKWTGYSDTEYDVSSCDLDLNGIVDSNDNVILARHLANWFGYLTIPVTNEN
ncbi:MAG: hypothetical protein IJD67_04550, partial [Clostridia bacterium]|nr:hypothetical protein [Clostridia bacterium]